MLLDFYGLKGKIWADTAKILVLNIQEINWHY